MSPSAARLTRLTFRQGHPNPGQLNADHFNFACLIKSITIQLSASAFWPLIIFRVPDRQEFVVIYIDCYLAAVLIK